MGNYIKRFAFWNPGTWSIPTLYWDAFSEEQRIHAISKQLGKVIAYADYLGINVDDIAARLKAIEEGQLDPYIIAKIEEWFEENQPEIVSALQNLNDALPISVYNSEHTVKDAFDSVGALITAIENRFPVTTPDISDGSVTKAKIDPAYTDVLDSYQTQIDDIRNKAVNPRRYVYVDCVNGDDANNGTSRDTPFRTLDRAMREQEYGYNDLYIEIIESGTYTIEDYYITNISMHLYANAENVIVNCITPEDYTQNFYNAYMHFETRAGISTKMVVYSQRGFHADASSIYAYRVTFRGEGNDFDMSMCNCHFASLVVFDNIRVYIRTSVVDLVNFTIINWDESYTSAPVSCTCSHVRIGTINAPILTENASYTLMNFAYCFTRIDTVANVSSSQQYKFAYGIYSRLGFLSTTSSVWATLTGAGTGTPSIQQGLVITKYAGEVIS